MGALIEQRPYGQLCEECPVLIYTTLYTKDILSKKLFISWTRQILASLNQSKIKREIIYFDEIKTTLKKNGMPKTSILLL
tara:strand:+ start:161 stop:400 length:240 start_codon:yes stop_codon:yes gene_type:complete